MFAINIDTREIKGYYIFQSDLPWSTDVSMQDSVLDFSNLLNDYSIPFI